MGNRRIDVNWFSRFAARLLDVKPGSRLPTSSPSLSLQASDNVIVLSCMTISEEQRGKPTDEILREQGVKSPARRRFLGALKTTAEVAGVLAGTTVGAGLLYEAVRPKGEPEGPGTATREIKIGDPVTIRSISQGHESDIKDFMYREIKTLQEYRDLVDKIVIGNPNLSTNQPNEPIINGFPFDPDKYWYVIFALGEKTDGYFYKPTVKHAALTQKGVDVSAEYTVRDQAILDRRQADHPDIVYGEPTGVSHPYHLVAINKVIRENGKPFPIILKNITQIPTGAEWVKASGGASPTSL